MWPDRVLNLGPLTYESGALPTALHGPVIWLLHHQKVTRYSCNLNIGMVLKHTVQTQIRLTHLSKVCTIRYSAV